MADDRQEKVLEVIKDAIDEDHRHAHCAHCELEINSADIFKDIRDGLDPQMVVNGPGLTPDTPLWRWFKNPADHGGKLCQKFRYSDLAQSTPNEIVYVANTMRAYKEGIQFDIQNTAAFMNGGDWVDIKKEEVT